MATGDREQAEARLGAFWDGLVRQTGAGQPEDAALDPELTALVRRFAALGAAPAPASAKKRIWGVVSEADAQGRDDMGRARPVAAGASGATNGRIASVPSRETVPLGAPTRRSWRVAEWATAAVVALTLLAIGVAAWIAPFGSDEGTNEVAGIPATATPRVPGASECRVEPRTLEEIAALVGVPTQVPGAPPPSMDEGLRGVPVPVGTVPPGQPADPATIASVRATLYEFTACDNAGDNLRLVALWSDRAVERYLGGNPDVSFTVVAAALTATTPMPGDEPVPPPDMADGDVRVLLDGRVGVLSHDHFAYEANTRPYLIMVEVDGRWLVDEIFRVDLEGIATPTAVPAIPGFGACRVTPRTVEEVATLAGVPVPEPGTQGIEEGGLEVVPAPTGSVPAGDPADAETITAIRATVYELTACANGGGIPYVLAFYTDHYLRTTLGQEGQSTFADLAAAFDEVGTPEPGDEVPVPEVRDEDVQVLPDGRVGLAAREFDQASPEPTFYVIFVRSGERWLIDNQFNLAESDVLPNGGDGGFEAPTTVPDASGDSIGGDIVFQELLPPTPVSNATSGVPITLRDEDDGRLLSLRVNADQAAAFLVENAGTVSRRFVVAGLGIDVEILPGERRLVEIDAPAGEYPLSAPGSGIDTTGVVAVRTMGTPVP